MTTRNSEWKVYVWNKVHFWFVQTMINRIGWSKMGCFRTEHRTSLVIATGITRSPPSPSPLPSQISVKMIVFSRVYLTWSFQIICTQPAVKFLFGIQIGRERSQRVVATDSSGRIYGRVTLIAGTSRPRHFIIMRALYKATGFSHSQHTALEVR